MHIHCIIHAPFETIGSIETWAHKAGYPISYSHTYKNDLLPTIESFDFLIVMGGPQSPRDVEKYPYLADEIRFTQQAIEHNKIVLGFCLGAQIIAESLGATTDYSTHKEVGCFPIELTRAGREDPIFSQFLSPLDVMHWHNDMPGIPKEGVLLATSSGCPRQAFRYGDRVYGLQFHPEMTNESIHAMVLNCPEDLHPGRYIQSKEDLLKVDTKLMNEKLNNFLNLLTN